MQPTIYRHLGATEQAIWLHDQAHPFHFMLTARIKGKIEPILLNSVLDSLQQRHPLLRVKIALDREHRPCFVEQQAPIPIRIIQRQSDQHWQQEAMEELQRPFIWSKAPLIRVILIHSPEVSELIIVCHHAIADGLAAANLIEEILILLNIPDRLMSNHPVPASLESLLADHQPVPRGKILLALGLVGLKQFTRWLKPKKTRSLLSSAPLPLQLEAGELSPAITSKLIDRCHQEETTVHGAICTAILLAIALNNQQQDLDLSTTLKCFCPVNLRPYLQSSLDRVCGLYIATAQTTHDFAEETRFWEIARLLKSELMTQVELDPLLKRSMEREILLEAKPSPEIVHKIFKERCACDVMVTNLGRLKIQQQFSNFRLEAIYGPIVLLGFPQERVLGVATLGDRLFFTFLHQQSIESNQTVHLAEQAIQLLKTALENPDFIGSTTAEAAEILLSKS